MPEWHVEHVLLGDLLELIDDNLTQRLNVPQLKTSSMMRHISDQCENEIRELSKVVWSQLEALQAHFYVIR